MAEREFTKSDRNSSGKLNYNQEIDRAKIARISQFNDTNPMVEKEGFLGVDDIDRMRRRKIK